MTSDERRIIQSPALSDDELAAFKEKVNSYQDLLQRAQQEIGKKIFGQREMVDNVLITLVAGGHGLLIGNPGLAKTTLINTLSTVVDLEDRRIQFTPDLLPTDVTGSSILDEPDENGRRHFRFVPGPIFCQLLLADEINRSPAKVQSALLEAMQERQVSVSSYKPFPLPRPFHVFATQNPVEQEGTYPLPEAQLDRFLMQIEIPYPDEETERKIGMAAKEVQVHRSMAETFEAITKTQEEGRHLERPPQTEKPGPNALIQNIITSHQLIEIQNFVAQKVPIGEKAYDAIIQLVRSSRPGQKSASDIANEYFSFGASPRAVQALVIASKARAILNGRYEASLEDVKALAPQILSNRIGLNYRAQSEKISMENLIHELVNDL